jgi:diguanylate cyclase
LILPHPGANSPGDHRPAVFAPDAIPGGMAPPRAPREGDRLADVRDLGLSEAGSDPELDAIVDTAALVAGAPISLLTVVEEHEQIFACAVGLAIDRTSRDVSFCGHAIAAGADPMIINDAREDPRFADNPLVTDEPRIIFYAGVPVITARGNAVGTLCVVDHEPRTLSDRQVAALVRLAGQAAVLIEGRRHGEDVRDRGAPAVDETTGLPGRDAMLASLARAGGIPAAASALALRVEDIDGGGAHGGLSEPGAVRAVARAISDCLPAPALCADAFGQFVVVLPGADGGQARAVVAAIRSRLRDAIVVESRISVHVGLTAGVAIMGQGLSASADALVAAAEEALQRAGTFSTSLMVLDDGIVASRARTNTIRNDLATAVTDGQLVVHYQPIVRLADGQVVGEEALVRWRHPDMGLLSPDEFIPFAEDMGIIEEIDRYVMRRALRDLAAGRTRGQEVSVNLSPVSVRDGLPGVVASDLRDARVTPANLVLELTERVRLDRHPGVREVLGALDDLGVRLAIDDFGAGTTSIAHLRNLPVSRLKIDRSMITDLIGPNAQRATMIVRTLRDLAGHLGLETLAEGVEFEAQRDLLTREGIPLAQGFLFGRPGPLREA